VSASSKTACVSCHLPELGWAVTEPRSRNDSGKLTSRKSPSLIGIGHLRAGAPNGWDGRNATLAAQAQASVATGSMSMRETETPVKVEVIEERIRAIPDYAARFKAALPNAPVNLESIATAIAAYETSFEPGPAPFDRWVGGDETDDNFHDIGTTTTDLGRGREVKDDPQLQYAFKTPTLRSVALRPPYMHNASAADLDAVIRHYEKGGIDRPSRSPMLMAIKLSDAERGDLVAFL
jgi:cytochrome c peroxidase